MSGKLVASLLAGALLLSAALARKPKPAIEQSLAGLTVNQSTLADARKLYGEEVREEFGALIFVIGPDCKLGVTANKEGVIEILDLDLVDATKPPPYSAVCDAVATGSGLKFGGTREQVNRAFGLADSAADPYGVYQLDNTAQCAAKPHKTPILYQLFWVKYSPENRHIVNIRVLGRKTTCDDSEIQMTLSDEGEGL
ncbi:MAG TPA: hypothetical protein VNK82_11925 [Terriglobales bacterium]|nr:hypothetical protein [Terriglobales bacterium]